MRELTRVKLGCIARIRYDFRLLKALNTIRLITKATKLRYVIRNKPELQTYDRGGSENSLDGSIEFNDDKGNSIIGILRILKVN